jgi:hypothetical protein
MNVDRVFAGLVAVSIVGLTLATGPVGPIQVGTDSEELQNPGSGTATVEVVAEPGPVVLEPSNDGQDVLYLSVPETTVRATNVTGNPILSYAVALDEIGFATDTIRPLGQSKTGELQLAIDRRTFQQYEAENVTEAELTVTLRGNETVTVFERVAPVDRP